MAKPPESGPHSDISGVNRDARVGAPTLDPAKATAADTARAEEESAGTPEGKPPIE